MTKDYFEGGDRVEHKGEGVRGSVDESNFAKMRVQWDDGLSTLETFHTVRHVEDEQ